MRYSFKQHEVNFKEWLKTYDGLSEDGKVFLRHIASDDFQPPLWKHQLEAIRRCIYSYEILDKPDLLVNVVTGGGKTVIIGAMIAYLTITQKANKFLILVPNTIVRQRLVDEFDPKSEKYVYENFPFFFNSFKPLQTRLSLHKMERGIESAGIRNANIILGNIHQIYEGRDNWKVISENVDKLVIFNDEAHNTKAEKYDDLINKLKPKRVFRLDTTATPDRLDGLNPDSDMIYRYEIPEAMKDKLIKRIVVFKPDIERVNLTYIDNETGAVINADEVPWEEIDKKRISGSRYITNPKVIPKQLAIAKECLDYQMKQSVKTTKTDAEGNPIFEPFKPLLFVVAISIRDAENIANILRNKPFNMSVLLVTNEEPEEKKEEAMRINRSEKSSKYDVIVSVMMLREGFDVKNISIISLFRKFTYKKVGDQTMSVYGPQVIGRGLRRISKRKEDWDNLFVVDHPILKHEWLWGMLQATHYSDTLNPGEIIDEQKIPKIKEGATREETVEEVLEKEGIDLSNLPPVPEPPEEVKVITEWQEYLDNYQYQINKVLIEEKIRQITSKSLESGFQTLDSGIPKIEVGTVEEKAKPIPAEELKGVISKELTSIARDALKEYDGNPDKRQEIIYRILYDHIKKRFLLGEELLECKNQRLLETLWAVISQIRDVFINPELIEGIFKKPPKYASE